MKKKSILKNALLLTGTDLLMRLFGIGFNAFLADRIGAEGLGLMQLVTSVGYFAMIVGSSGVRVAAMCLTAEEFGKRSPEGAYAAVRACLRYGFTLSSTAAVLLLVLAPKIATGLLGNSAALLPLRILAVFLPFSCLCGVMTGYFTACSRIRQMAAVQITERLFSMGFTVLILLWGAKGGLGRACSAIVLGSSLGAMLEFAVLYLCFHRDTRPLRKNRQRVLPKMGTRLKKLCLPLALNDYLRAGLNTAEQLLIPFGLAKYGASGGGALAAHGTIHAMVFPILMFPAAILYAVSDLLVPELSRSRAMGRTLRIRDLADKCLRLTWLFACAAGGVLFCCARSLGLWIYDSTEAGYYLKIFAPMVLMLYLDAITDGMLKGLSQQLSCVRYNTFTSLLDVLFLFFLLPRWGLWGYIFSFAVTHGINLFLSLHRLLRVTNGIMHTKELVRSFACLFLALPAAMLFPSQGTAMGDALCRGSFFLCLLLASYLLFRALSDRDLHWLRGVFRRSSAK